MFLRKIKLANSKNSGGGGQLNNKAFTLIELLAIIVILAIIAVITIPIILNVIDNSKRGAAIDSAYGYRDAIKKYYMSKMLDDNSYVIEDGEHDVLSYVNEGLDVSGEKPSQGWVIIQNREVTDFSIKIGDYIVTYNSSTNTTVAEKGSNVALTPTQEKAQTYLTSLKTTKGNVGDIFNLPVEGVSSTDVTSGWVALNNGEVIGYSLQVGDKTTTLSTKNDSIDSIVETLATAYLNGLTTPNSETVIDVTESGKLKSGFIEYKSNGTSIVINDYSLKYEIDGITKYANYVSNQLTIQDVKRNKPIAVGSTVHIGDEGFYVMSINDDTATLLANTCLTNVDENWRQVTDGEACTNTNFSTSNYWNGKVGSGLDYPGSYCTSTSQTGCAYVYDVKNGDTNNVKTIVDLYAESLSEDAIGRIMKLEEAYNLDSSIRNISKNYGLGLAYNTICVWYVTYNGDLSNVHYTGAIGVRPVIEISTSEIQ